MKTSNIYSLFLIISTICLFSCEESNNNTNDYYYIPGDLLHVNIYERNSFYFDYDSTAPQGIIHISTDEIYPCCNWPLNINKIEHPSYLNITIQGLYIPNICATAFGPAQSYTEFNLNNGNYSINIKTDDLIDQLLIYVTDSSIQVNSHDPSFITIDDTLIWRYRPNSFVYNCGTLHETDWIYSDFKDSILSVEGIKQFYYSEIGRIPYARYSDGHYSDHPCLFFQYSDEFVWEIVKEKLISFSTNTISQYEGVGIYLENFMGDRVLSWLYD